MATLHGADFTTQGYRHGVLVGNWNEDQYGLDILKAGNSRTLDSLSVTQASYTTKGHSAIHNETYASKYQPRFDQEVSATLLFPHRGEPTKDDRYLTTNRLTYHAGKVENIAIPVEKMIEKESKDQLDQSTDHGRQRSYRTAYSDTHHAASTTNAVPPQPNPLLRRGEMTKTFDATYRSLRLRK